MNGALGHTGVLLGFAAAVVGIVVIAVGLARGRPPTMRSGQIYAPLILLGGVVATVAMEHALITHDFSLAYVADNNSRSHPAALLDHRHVVGAGRIDPAVGGGPRRATPRPWCGASAAGPATTWWPGPPWWSTWWPPSSSASCWVRPIPSPTWSGPSGQRARAQRAVAGQPAGAFHPPLLYLGLVGFTLPFAFAIASLITGRLDEDWQGETRRWTLFAWAFLTVGILLGRLVVLPGARVGRVLGLGPGGERRAAALAGGHRLPPLGDGPAAAGPAAGLEPVPGHRHLQPDHPGDLPDPVGGHPVGPRVLRLDHRPLLLGFFGVVLVAGVGLIAWRGDRLRSPGGIDSPVSREGAFLVNNLLFVGFAFIVLLGTVFPLLYEALEHGTQVTVGAPYFNASPSPSAWACCS